MASKSKSYRNNPALQFISTAMVEEAQEVQEAPAAPPERTAEAPVQAQEAPAPQAPAVEPTKVSAPPKRTAGEVVPPASAPTFQAPPVPYAPIQAHAAPEASPYAQAAAAPHTAYAAAGPMAQSATAFEVPMKPVYVEVRSKRFNALMQPSLFRNLSILAGRDGVSVNELMHQALEQYARERMKQG